MKTSSTRRNSSIVFDKEKVRTRLLHDQIYVEITAFAPVNWPILLSMYYSIGNKIYGVCHNTMWNYYLRFPEVNISVTEWGEQDLQTNFICLWGSNLHFFYDQWLSSLPSHRSCITFTFSKWTVRSFGSDQRRHDNYSNQMWNCLWWDHLLSSASADNQYSLLTKNDNKKEPMEQ